MTRQLRRLATVVLTLALAAFLVSQTSKAQTGITWTSLVSATASGSGLTPTSADARGESSQSITAGNGSLKVYVWSEGDGNYTRIGLANGTFTGSGSEIDYGWSTYGSVANCRRDGNALNSLIDISNGDSLEIRINGTTVEWYHNTTLVYSMTGQTLSYPYRAVAYFSSSTAPPISSATVTTTAPLLTPAALAATNGSGNDINLSWSYSGTGQAGFKIERKLGRNGTYAEIGTVGASTLTYSDTGSKTANRVYAYRVRAYRTGEDGPYSGYVQATTPYTGGGGVKTDRAVYAEPSLPPLPHAGGKWRDEVFGTEIMRVTDEDDGPAPGLSTYYSHWPTFNCDATRLLIRKGENGEAIVKNFDPANFTLGTGSTALPTSHPVSGNTFSWESATWSNVNPDVIYVHIGWYGTGAMKLYSYNIATNTPTLVRDFSALSGSSTDYLAQMYMSADDDVFCWLKKRGGVGGIGYLVYKKSTDTVLYNEPDNYTGGIDEVHVDKSGKWLHIVIPTAQADGTSTRFLNLQTGAMQAIVRLADHPPGHGDMGTEIMVGFDDYLNGLSYRHLSDMHAWSERFYFRTGSKGLTGTSDWTQDFHGTMLANNEDWITIGTYDMPATTLPDSGVFEDEIMQVALDDSEQVRRLAHTRTTFDDQTSTTGYWATPRPTISKDGRYIAFTSNWENSGRTDMFILRVQRAPFLTLQDDFNDNSRDAKKWSVGLLGSAVSDTNVPVSEQNQRLELTPLTATSGSHANGYSTVTPMDMTGKQAGVEVVQVTNTAGWANTVFSLAADDGWYRFFTEHGLLYMEQYVGGNSSGATPISYSSTQHRHWRIRHDPFSDAIYWETSSDGATWTVRHSAARQLSMTRLVADLYVRTWQSEVSPGVAVFDNFKFESVAWAARDVGFSGLAGSASATTGGTYTLNAAGDGIWYSEDGFYYLYRKMSGDGTVVARVASIQNASSTAKAGVMIRERLVATSRHASMLLSADGNAILRRRLSDDCNTNCDTTSTTVSSVSAPYWVKLVRSGNNFSGYRSSDGVNWQLVDSATISMGSSVYVGLAVTNHNTGAQCTATFDNVNAPGP